MSRQAVIAKLEAALAEANALAVEEPTPPPLGDHVVLLGNAVTSQQFGGMADRTTRTKIAEMIAQVPAWNVFADAQKHISPSRNGVRASAHVKLHVWGNMNGLYQGIPHEDGRIYPTLSQDLGLMSDYLDANPRLLKSGPRGVNICTPYTTWHGHTRIKDDGTLGTDRAPLFVGITLNGWIVYLFRDGSVLYVTKLDCRGASDIAFSEANRKIFYVADSTKQRILKVDRSAGEDPSVWVRSVFATGFTHPTSIREVDGDLYVADTDRIFKLDAAGGKTVVANVPGAFWIDYLSTHDLVVTTTKGTAYVMDRAGTVLRTHAITIGPWTTVSVDRNGTWGPKDEYSIIQAQGGSGNIDWWRWQDGQLKYYPLGIAIGGNTVGNVTYCQDQVGHYLWVSEHHPDEAILLVQGLSDVQPSLLAARPAIYPAEEPYDHNLLGRGNYVINYGTVPGELFESKPSFTCQMENSGWSFLGCVFDVIAEKPFAEQAVFFQAGGIGSFRRDGIKGRDLYGLLYLVNRNSQRFLRDGKAHMDALKAYCTPMFGQELPPVTQTPPNAETDVQVDLKSVGGELVAQFSNKHGHPVTPNAAVRLRVLIDEGFPEQVDLGEVGSPWRVPMPAIPAGQHAARAVQVSGHAAYRGRSMIVRT